MSLQDQIAALPGWPGDITREGPYKVYKGERYTVYDDGASAETPYMADLAESALARLALAREWAALAHRMDCGVMRGVLQPCTCGRDALLKELSHEP
jgi:hypothetical protein